MSSMIEGSDDGAREDEPQLENNGDEQLHVASNGQVNNEGDGGQYETEPGQDAFLDDNPLSATSSQDPAGMESDSAVQNGSGEASSVHQRPGNREIGSGDESGSIPDDTPSVQVRCVRFSCGTFSSKMAINLHRIRFFHRGVVLLASVVRHPT